MSLSGFFKRTVEVDLNKTPWVLKLKAGGNPIEILVYFTKHEEAKDHEVICIQKGWTSLGVSWYNNI